LLPTFEVDLTSHVKNVIKLLEKVPIIGLVGMGGIGKTILSKKVYHSIHNQYEKSRFLGKCGIKKCEGCFETTFTLFVWQEIAQ
jgi:ABC-type glutathione transport system ATPase component